MTGHDSGDQPEDVSFHKILTSFFKTNTTIHTNQQNTKHKQFHAKVTRGLLTQNVQGFKQTNSSRDTWLAGWKKHLDGHPVAFVCIQETHVSSLSESMVLRRKWAAMWGVRVDPARQLSFWSVSDQRAAGVAILLHPHCTEKFTQTPMAMAQDRAMAIHSTTRTSTRPMNESVAKSFF